MLQIVASLTDNSRDAIYNCNMLIVKATGVHNIKHFRMNLITLFVSYIKILYNRFFSLLALNRSNLPKRKSKWTKKSS